MSEHKLLEGIYLEAQQRVNKALRVVHWNYTLTMEALIGRYQADLWRAAESYVPRIQSNNAESHVVYALVSELDRLGDTYLAAASNVGLERALRDLIRFGWLRSYSRPVSASRDILDAVTRENKSYLFTSLLPDLTKSFASSTDGAAVIDAYRARIGLYSHYLWTASQRAYRLTLQDFERFHNAKDVSVAV